MKFLKICFTLLLVFTVQLSFAKDIYISKQKNNKGSRKQFMIALNKAKSGDVIIVDQDIVLQPNDNPIHISKSNITIEGKNNHKITRTVSKSFLVKITGDDITLKNLHFSNAVQLVFIYNKEKIQKNITVKDCYFEHGKYTGLNMKGKFFNTKIINSTFKDCKFSIQTMDSPILKNFTIDKCKFIEGDHQISLDNPHAEIIEHKNIQIKNSDFELAERFNLALANTRNVTIKNCNFAGGKGNYSQALHFEDRTQNVLVKNNKIKCMADVPILLYATDKIGHGTGRKLTNKEKQAYGSGNITLDGNVIESGDADVAISIGYGKGFLKIKKNNVIKSQKNAIRAYRSSKTLDLIIEDDTFIKGKKYSEIKVLAPKIKQQYILIK